MSGAPPEILFKAQAPTGAPSSPADDGRLAAPPSPDMVPYPPPVTPPAEVLQPPTGASPKSNAGKWLAVALAVIIIVAGIAVVRFYTPPAGGPPSNGGSGVPANSTGVFPTAWARISLHGTGSNSNINGIIDIELYGNETPRTVQNFLDLGVGNYYSGTVIHRVESNFVIQGGGYDEFMNYKDPAVQPIPLEVTSKLKNLKGTIAMARASDPDSATSQFYFNVVDNPHLDAGYGGGAGYTVFGKRINSAGMDLVNRIDQVPIKAGTSNVPADPIIIDTVTNLGAPAPM